MTDYDVTNEMELVRELHELLPSNRKQYRKLSRWVEFDERVFVLSCDFKLTKYLWAFRNYMSRLTKRNAIDCYVMASLLFARNTNNDRELAARFITYATEIEPDMFMCWVLKADICDDESAAKRALALSRNAATFFCAAKHCRDAEQRKTLLHESIDLCRDRKRKKVPVDAYFMLADQLFKSHQDDGEATDLLYEVKHMNHKVLKTLLTHDVILLSNNQHTASFLCTKDALALHSCVRTEHQMAQVFAVSGNTSLQRFHLLQASLMFMDHLENERRDQVEYVLFEHGVNDVCALLKFDGSYRPPQSKPYAEPIRTFYSTPCNKTLAEPENDALLVLLRTRCGALHKATNDAILHTLSLAGVQSQVSNSYTLVIHADKTTDIRQAFMDYITLPYAACASAIDASHILYLVGHVFRREQMHDHAIFFWYCSLALNPNNDKVLSSVAAIHSDVGSDLHAEYFWRFIFGNGRHYCTPQVTVCGFAGLLFRTNRCEEALQVLEKAHQANPLSTDEIGMYVNIVLKRPDNVFRLRRARQLLESWLEFMYPENPDFDETADIIKRRFETPASVDYYSKPLYSITDRIIFEFTVQYRRVWFGFARSKLMAIESALEKAEKQLMIETFQRRTRLIMDMHRWCRLLSGSTTKPTPLARQTVLRAVITVAGNSFCNTHGPSVSASDVQQIVTYAGNRNTLHDWLSYDHHPIKRTFEIEHLNQRQCDHLHERYRSNRYLAMDPHGAKRRKT